MDLGGVSRPTGPPPLPPLRCRGGKPDASAPSAPASACRRSPVATERSAVGTFPVAARRGDRSRFEVVVREVARLRGRRRKAEELGDDGFGGAQHRGDQRRQVEVALAGGGAPGKLAEDSRWKSGGRKE